jgi:hypothetical protein
VSVAGGIRSLRRSALALIGTSSAPKDRLVWGTCG